MHCHVVISLDRIWDIVLIVKIGSVYQRTEERAAMSANLIELNEVWLSRADCWLARWNGQKPKSEVNC